MRHGRVISSRYCFCLISIFGFKPRQAKTCVSAGLRTERNDWILCQITSKSYNDNKAIRIDETDYKNGGLNLVSFVRPGKLFTANIALINKNVATLTDASHEKVISAILRLLKNDR